MKDLVEAVLAGERRALARILTWVENEREGVDSMLASLYQHTGNAWVIGITGAPGTGKSSLVSALTRTLRDRGQTVGIIAVDPTSPFSGGAILGDRIRMQDLHGDSGVFIRSMATRGSLGGLSRATRDATRVMDAAGFDVVVIETVGAGQNEVEIVRASQTTVVVEAPGLGDDVQAIKAGILEIADVLVVNKSDRPGAIQTVRALKAMLQLGHPAQRSQLQHHGQLMTVNHPPATVAADAPMWIPPIVQTSALENTGLDEFVDALDSHREFLRNSDSLAQLEGQQIENELRDRLQVALLQQLLDVVPSSVIGEMIGKIQSRELAPQEAVRQILKLANIV